jgi:hypothetical protein
MSAPVRTISTTSEARTVFHVSESIREPLYIYTIRVGTPNRTEPYLQLIRIDVRFIDGMRTRFG